MGEVILGSLVWGALKLTSSLISAGWQKLTGDSGDDDSQSGIDTFVIDWGGDIVVKARDKQSSVVAHSREKLSSHSAPPFSAALEANRNEVHVHKG